MPKRMVGLSLGSQHWALYENEPLASTSKRIPISALLPRVAGERIRVDAWYPPHPRGSGATWPPEAVVGAGRGAGRIPMAACWSGRQFDNDQFDNEWRWGLGEEIRTVLPMEALAAVSREAVSKFASAARVALIIPNDLKQRDQQQILDSVNKANSDTQLLWLPVAAVLSWISDKKTKLNSGHKRLSGQLPGVLVVHADWGTTHCSVVKLRTEINKDKELAIIPVRGRASTTDFQLPGTGWASVEASSSQDLAEAWKATFASQVRRSLVSQQTSDKRQSAWLHDLVGWDIKQTNFAFAAMEIIDFLIKQVDEIGTVIFVGDFAEHLSNSFLSELNISEAQWKHARPDVVCWDGLSGEEALAKGGSIHLRRLANGDVSYYDTLPELELFIDRSGAYEWLNLLDDDASVVEGGRQWKRANPITGLSIPRGSSQVKLVVAHEEYVGVRELFARFDSTSELRIPVSLHVSCVPAQGNAKLRLKTEDTTNHRSSEVLADWRRMKTKLDRSGQPMDKETYQKEQPRSYPELRPRHADTERWYELQQRADQFLKNVPNGRAVRKEFRYLGQLLETSRIRTGKSAISTDGSPPSPRHQQDVDRIVQILLEFVSLPGTRVCRVRDAALKTLGFMSADCDGMDDWLYQEISQATKLNEPICIAASGCIRSAKTSDAFIRRLLDDAPNSNLGRLLSYQMQALGRLLSVREDVLKNLPESYAMALVKECLQVFKQQLMEDNLAWLFEHSGLAVVYALRYRMQQPDFLDPESELAIMAKQTFTEAIERLASRSSGRNPWRSNYVLTPARCRRLSKALKQLIDYIDRLGTGDILIATDD